MPSLLWFWSFKEWNLLVYCFFHPLINTQFNNNWNGPANETLIYLERSLCEQLPVLAMVHSFWLRLLILRPRHRKDSIYCHSEDANRWTSREWEGMMFSVFLHFQPFLSIKQYFAVLLFLLWLSLGFFYDQNCLPVK